MELDTIFQKLREPMIRDIRRLVHVKSVYASPIADAPFGEGIRAALLTALDIARDLGYKTVNMDNHIGYAEYGESDDYIAVLGHVDVVAEGSGWRYPPFDAMIHDGRMYGRGVEDDKGPMIAALYGVKAMIDSGVRFNKKVRFIFGTDEENGSKDIEYYVRHEKQPVGGFTPDAEFPIILSEKGAMLLDIEKQYDGRGPSFLLEGGIQPNAVPASCILKTMSALRDAPYQTHEKVLKKNDRQDGQYILEFVGKESHGCIPQRGVNSILHMLHYLSGETLPFLPINEDIQFLDDLLWDDLYGQRMGIANKDQMGPLTVNLSTLNATEEKISFTLDIRYPISSDGRELLDIITGIFSEKGYSVKERLHLAPLCYDEQDPLVRGLKQVYEGETGDMSPGLTTSGSTYAKSLQNIVGFGPLLPGRDILAHQVDESMALSDLYLCARIYGKAAYALCQ